jgi:sulfatase modifying factor 1
MKNMLLLFLVTITLTISGQSQGSADKEDFPEPSISQEIILIKGGSFIMGKTSNPNSNYVDNAKHKVSVSDFYLDKYEVTNTSYNDFAQETGHRLPEFLGMDVYRSGLEYPDYPVVGVTWADESKYAEWEYAAR